jgi:hypothetical protein
MNKDIIRYIFALSVLFMSLMIIAPELWAQKLICEEVNGLLWCYNDQACGQPCNEVCETIGSQPIADNTVWLEAQDTEEECRAISQAFGLGEDVDVDFFNAACIEDAGGNHTVGGGLIPPLWCSAFPSCPAFHRSGMDQQNIPCGPSSRRSLCPCVPPPPQSINLSPTTETSDVGTDHTVTATVDTSGIPEPGVFVTFEVTSGPNVGVMSEPNNGECSSNDDCTTDVNGRVSWTYSSVMPGTDVIVASFQDKTSRVIKSTPVEKTWESLPIPTLSEWGLVAMSGILGIVGFLVIRRRKVTA